MNRKFRSKRVRLIATASVGAMALFGMTACSNSSGGASGSKKSTAVTLIIKTADNPYFTSMEAGAEAEAKKLGVHLTTAAGKTNGDEATQITAIENAVSRGDAGILITPAGTGVENALVQARKAGLFVIALDTPPANTKAVDITFATDNLEAGNLIGQWTAKKLEGKKAVIGMVDAYNNQIVSTDLLRDLGFLKGMGIKTPNTKVFGSEAKTGTYTGGAGGDYQIVAHAAGQADEADSRTATETLISQNPKINVVYTINEPAALGAAEAVAAAHLKDVLVVTVDGGCAGVAKVKAGTFNADSEQYPVVMAKDGVDAIYKLITKGVKPKDTAGKSFFDTGAKLVTDDPQAGVPSITTSGAENVCWGPKS